VATFYSNGSNTYQLILEVNQASQSIDNNNSVLNWALKMSCGGNYYQNQNTKDSFYVAINGEVVYNTTKAVYFSGAYTTVTIATGSLTVAHNSDGSKNVPASFSFYPAKTANYYPGSMSGSGNLNLTQIPRQATLTAAPNFTDEDNPVITYSNPAGDAVTSLKACIASADGKYTYADYRDVSKTGTSYTFNLTGEERNALRWASINSPNLTVKFYVTTVIGGNTYYSTLDKIMTITNAHPTLTAAVEDVGGTSVSLTGDKNKIIKGFNYITASMTATALKGASIKTQTITNGSKLISAASGNFENVESGTFVFTATDSRGYATTQTITKELIEYIKLTCNMDVDNPNTDGETTLKISGNYFNGSFGKVANTLQVQYRYKESDGNYSEWIDAEFTLSNNTYNSTTDITGLNYQKAYTFQARAIDKVYPEVVTAEKKVKSIPVFDWGENDFNINGDLSVSGNFTINGNTLLDIFYPVGSIYMSVDYFDPATKFGGKWERLMDKFLLGSGAIYASGQEGGEATHTLTVEELPNHRHEKTAEGHTPKIPGYMWESGDAFLIGAGGWKPDSPGYAGGDQPHNNMPPYLTVNMWKRVE
jgi:hypothetical protein